MRRGSIILQLQNNQPLLLFLLQLSEIEALLFAIPLWSRRDRSNLTVHLRLLLRCFRLHSASFQRFHDNEREIWAMWAMEDVKGRKWRSQGCLGCLNAVVASLPLKGAINSVCSSATNANDISGLPSSNDAVRLAAVIIIITQQSQTTIRSTWMSSGRQESWLGGGYYNITAVPVEFNRTVPAHKRASVCGVEVMQTSGRRKWKKELCTCQDAWRCWVLLTESECNASNCYRQSSRDGRWTDFGLGLP